MLQNGVNLSTLVCTDVERTFVCQSGDKVCTQVDGVTQVEWLKAELERRHNALVYAEFLRVYDEQVTRRCTG